MYRRWQPMYDVMKRSVTPPIEFVKGIPMDIERDHYLDSSIPNLLIMDDLMSTTSKDKRVNEIFYADSHHRNASVITMNQNLYYNKDPTQRRNCHYLILFNNPVDKQSIMTLGRQMYPSNSQYFLRHFEDAVSKPYGYLLVDLKTTTPEHLRLRGNALDEKPEVIIRIDNEEHRDAGAVISDIEEHRDAGAEDKRLTPQEHRDTGIEEKFTTDSLISCLSPCNICGIVFFTDKDLKKHEKDKHSAMFPCEECGAVYATESGLNKHERVHDCDSEMEDYSEDESPTMEWTDEQREFWHDISRSEIWDEMGDEVEKIEENYREDGYDDDTANDMAINEMLPELRKSARKHFTKALITITHLRYDKVYQRLIETAAELRRKSGLDKDTAIKEAIRLYKEPLGELLVEERDVDTDEQSEDEQSDDEQSEDEN